MNDYMRENKIEAIAARVASRATPAASEEARAGRGQGAAAKPAKAKQGSGPSRRRAAIRPLHALRAWCCGMARRAAQSGFHLPRQEPS